MPAVAAAQDNYDHMIELAAGWLDDTWWIARRVRDDEEAEAKRLAIHVITKGLPEPEGAAATVRARVVERYRAAGEGLPRWFLGKAARELLDNAE